MAAWGGLKAWAAGDPLLAQQLIDYVNKNLEYLLAPNNFYVSDTGTYSTSSTSYAPVNAVFTKSITVYGGHVLCGFSGALIRSAGSGQCSLAIGVDGGSERLILRTNNGVAQHLTSTILITGLSPGAHSISLRFKVEGTATLQLIGADSGGVAIPPLIFWGLEI